jgi:hypothetical protein
MVSATVHERPQRRLTSWPGSSRSRRRPGCSPAPAPPPWSCRDRVQYGTLTVCSMPVCHLPAHSQAAPTARQPKAGPCDPDECQPYTRTKPCCMSGRTKLRRERGSAVCKGAPTWGPRWAVSSVRRLFTRRVETWWAGKVTTLCCDLMSHTRTMLSAVPVPRISPSG